MSNIMLIVIGMTVVTYIPRMVPFFVFSGKELPNRLKMFLEFVPYTALGALIIPGAIDAIPNEPFVAIIGLMFAFIYSYKKGDIIISVIGSIAVVYVMLLI